MIFNNEIFKLFEKRINMYKRNLKEISGFIAKDGSYVKEVINPRIFDVKDYSIAFAIIKGSTKMHYHKTSEEVYFVLKGRGKMFLDDKWFDIKEGDFIVIKPGIKHKVMADEIHIICYSHPSYKDDDTVCLE